MVFAPRRTVVLLEGGYDVDMSADCAIAVIGELLRDANQNVDAVISRGTSVATGSPLQSARCDGPDAALKRRSEGGGSSANNPTIHQPTGLSDGAACLAHGGWATHTETTLREVLCLVGYLATYFI